VVEQVCERIEAAPQTTARTPAASAAKVSVSQPLSSAGPSVWISSVAATASPPVSFRQVTGSSCSCAAVSLTPEALGRL